MSENRVVKGIYSLDTFGHNNIGSGVFSQCKMHENRVVKGNITLNAAELGPPGGGRGVNTRFCKTV